MSPAGAPAAAGRSRVKEPSPGSDSGFRTGQNHLPEAWRSSCLRFLWAVIFAEQVPKMILLANASPKSKEVCPVGRVWAGLVLDKYLNRIQPWHLFHPPLPINKHDHIESLYMPGMVPGPHFLIATTIGDRHT